MRAIRTLGFWLVKFQGQSDALTKFQDYEEVEAAQSYKPPKGNKPNGPSFSIWTAQENVGRQQASSDDLSEDPPAFTVPLFTTAAFG